MGSGCSSPLRRLGGKRGKPRRDSSPFGEINGSNSDNQDQRTSDAARYQQPIGQKFNLENEITIQSEINDDHPSSASYYTDGKNQNEETKISEHSEPKSSTVDPVSSIGGCSVVARMMGLDGAHMPLDRHLLVSPALSPAPSTCYSPLSAGSLVGFATSIDLSDLNEAFKTLTFGLSDPTSRIKQPARPHSELHNKYTQQLVQTQSDLINYISVIFITTDNFQFKNSDSKQSAGVPYILSQKIELLANHIESNSKSFCDQHLFKLRFFNLSLSHLSENFHINNLIDVSMKILEQEYLVNSQRLILVVLSNNSNNINGGSIDALDGVSEQNFIVDTKQLPTKIEAQSMNKLIKSSAANSDDKFKSLLKRWYNQIGNIFYLNPIYLVYSKISSQSKEERDQAWQDWLQDASVMIKAIELAIENEPKLASEIKFESLFESLKEFIVKESTLQKRTLLVRNYLQPSSNSINLPQQQSQSSSSGLNKHDSLNELARLLSDPNKLTIKRSMIDEEFIRTVNDWINENLCKFVESILENRIIRGKHVPPFIERNLFRELTSQRHYLYKHLDDTTENFEARSRSFYNNQILPILNTIVNNGNNTLQSCSAESTSTTDQEQPSPSPQPSTNHLVFISGPKGCGKSTLFAQLIKLTVEDLLNKVQIIYRFCGLTLDSSTPNRLLRSICEQFCQTQGENITAASYIYSARKEIMNALNKIMNFQTSVIFLDGLDVYDKSVLTELDWLHEIRVDCRIKIFVMLETDSDLYKKVLEGYPDATHISLDHPTISEWAQMLISTARSKRFNSVANLYDEIKNLKTSANLKEEPNLTYSDVIDVINMCRIRQLNNESIYPELSLKNIQTDPLYHLKNIQQAALMHLHYLITPYQLCSLFIMLDSSRNGLSESDIINVMTLISQTSKSSPNIELRFSSALLNYLQLQLQPWLVYILCDKTVKITVQRDFLKKVIDYYVPNIYPNIVSEVRDILLNYFSRQAKSKLSRSSIFKGENNNQLEFRDNVGPSECQWLSSQASEIVNLLILTNPIRARDYLLSKNQFFLQFLYSSMPEEFIEDCHKLKEIAGKKPMANSEELQYLVNFIMRSIYPLRYDGSQIFSQIYCRSFEIMKTGKFSKSKKFNDLLNVAACPPIRNLLPISEASVNSFIKTRIGQKQQNSGSSLNAPPINNQRSIKSSVYSSSQPPNSSNQTKQRIYTIKGNHRHVIVIYPDRGSLSVWDIFEEIAVRTISNMDQPRDLKMIDQKRAVILCNRELRVYDLDSGNLLTKLKGVMNQKMPFFEVFDENYVVALARNRMYVNMMNLNTGELETTFKVGEDRFLNSLLVSADGGICVCGDETQKPFPLLVWNLNERRLLYDLRLDRHEFITRMSAISDDGHFVVSVCKQVGDSNDNPTSQHSNNSSSTGSGSKSSPNFIVIYDLSSGTLFKKWKPGLDSCSVAISLSTNRSGKVINTIIDSSILVWDLATGSRRHTLTGHSAPPDVIKVQNNTLFSMDSSCRDQSLRIWDIEEGHCLAVFSPDAPVNCCQISTRGDALVCGFAAETRLSTLVICKNETVNDVVKRNKRRKSSKSLYIFDEPSSRKPSS